MLMGSLAALFLMPRPAAAVDLTMYYPVAVGGPVTKIIDDMVGRFEKENPDIKVTAVYAGNYTDTMTKAMTAMKGGQPPQLSVLLSTDVFTLIDENAIVPLDGLADKAWFKDFYPAFMANGQVDGKTWSIPFQRSTIVLYWNKDAFKEAGLDPEKAPASWDEMVAMGKTLVRKDAGGNVIRWGVEIPTTGYAYWMLQALAIENGQKLMNDAGNEVYLTAPKTVAALDYWVDLSRKDKVMPTGTVDWATLRTDFLEGKTAMMWHTTGNLTAVKDNAQFNFGVAMLPAKERRGSPGGGAGTGRSRPEGIQVEKAQARRAADRRPASHPMTDQAIESLAAPRPPKSHGWWNPVNGWLLLLPAAVLLAAFTHYPIIATIR